MSSLPAGYKFKLVCQTCGNYCNTINEEIACFAEPEDIVYPEFNGEVISVKTILANPSTTILETAYKSRFPSDQTTIYQRKLQTKMLACE